jgi:hypothetical protein
MTTENEIIVEKLVEHEDGSATYTFAMSEKSTQAMAQYGLELVLICAAYGVNMNDAFDSIRAAGGDQRMSDYRIEAATKEEWAIRALNAEESNKELTLQLLATSGQAADALDKLAKAVEALRECQEALRDHMKQYPHMAKGYTVDAEKNARAVLAELEGGE